MTLMRKAPIQESLWFYEPNQKEKNPCPWKEVTLGKEIKKWILVSLGFVVFSGGKKKGEPDNPNFKPFRPFSDN